MFDLFYYSSYLYIIFSPLLSHLKRAIRASRFKNLDEIVSPYSVNAGHIHVNVGNVS